MLTDARHADVRRAPTVEVELTVRARRPRERARLTRAWTRVVALGFAALVGCAVFDRRGSQTIGAVLVVSTYVLTFLALAGAALETHRSNSRRVVAERPRARAAND